MKVWMDGKIVDGSEARVSVTDHGLLYGDGIFEGMRVYAGRVFRIEQHLARLSVSARALALEIPASLADVRGIVEDTVRAFGQREAYIRLLVTRGEGPLGVDPTTCPQARIVCMVSTITLFTEEQRERGLDMITSSYRRPQADMLDMRIKSLNYLNSVMAKLEAKQRGADDALILNPRGHISEATGANLFVVRGRELMTPPTTDGCLEGITRRAITELARTEGFDVSERCLGRMDVFAADEVFLTGSGAGVAAVRSLDARPIGAGKRGPITARFAHLHRQLAEREGTQIVG